MRLFENACLLQAIGYTMTSMAWHFSFDSVPSDLASLSIVFHVTIGGMPEAVSKHATVSKNLRYLHWLVHVNFDPLILFGLDLGNPYVKKDKTEDEK